MAEPGSRGGKTGGLRDPECAPTPLVSLLRILVPVRRAPGVAGARRCLPQRPCACSRQARRAAAAGAERLGAGSPTAPPRAPRPGRRDRPSAPRALRRSSRLCNVSSRSGSGGGGDASGSGPRPRGSDPARHGGPAGAHGPARSPFRASGARQPALRAPARRSDSKPAPAAAAATKDRGRRARGTGRGTDHRAARPPRLRFPGGRSRSPNPSRPHHMTAATQRPGESACCPLACATAAGAGVAAPLPLVVAGRRPRAPLGLQAQEPGEPPPAPSLRWPTLLRKIGLIRLHNRDTEDPKHHHNHRAGGGGGRRTRRCAARAAPRAAATSPQQPHRPGARATPAPGPARAKASARRAGPARQGAAATGGRGGSAGRRGPRGGRRGARAGPGPAAAAAAAAGGSLVPAARQQHCAQVRSRRLMKGLRDIARLSSRFASVELVGREPVRLEREAAPGGQGLGAVAGHEGDQHSSSCSTPPSPATSPSLRPSCGCSARAWRTATCWTAAPSAWSCSRRAAGPAPTRWRPSCQFAASLVKGQVSGQAGSSRRAGRPRRPASNGGRPQAPPLDLPERFSLARFPIPSLRVSASPEFGLPRPHTLLSLLLCPRRSSLRLCPSTSGPRLNPLPPSDLASFPLAPPPSPPPASLSAP